MTKSEYNQLFDDASDELDKIYNKERFIEHFEFYKQENGSVKPEALVAFAYNEAFNKSRDYLHLLLQKFLDVDE